MLIEACVDSVAGAIAAEGAGARRLELCASLVEGGTTPSIGMIATVRARVALPIVVMIRPRGGDFLYAADELEAMRRDIAFAREAGADEVAVGALTRDGEVDVAALRTLLDVAAGTPVIFHRAFDMASDLLTALETLVEAGVRRVLTSGGAPRAIDGVDAIDALVRQSADRIEVMAGGGVRPGDVPALARAGVREVHVGGAVMEPSEMIFRRHTIGFGRPLPRDEFTRAAGDVARWRAVVDAAGRAGAT